MCRPTLANSRTPALLLVAAGMLVSACSAPPEENVLRQYFRASGLRDKASLASFATVEFNPQTDGSVISVKVVSVSPERADGSLVSKDVTAEATVKAPDGATRQKQLVVTLTRAVVKGANGERTSTWIVTAIRGT